MVVEEKVGGEVGARLVEGCPARIDGRLSFAEAERDFRVAGDFRGVEKKKAVDQVGGKCSAIEARASLEEDIENFAAAEFVENGFQIELALPARDAMELGTGGLQLAGFGRLERGCGKDEQIVVYSLHGAGFGREAELRVENHTEQFAAAREAAAIGEKGIVGEDGADAGENCVACMAHMVDFGAGLFGSNPLAHLAFGGDAQGEL